MEMDTYRSWLKRLWLWVSRHVFAVPKDKAAVELSCGYENDEMYELK